MKALQLTVVLAVCLAASCGSKEPADSGCTPGETKTCACVGGASGAQTCTPGGESFGLCACPDAGGSATADTASEPLPDEGDDTGQQDVAATTDPGAVADPGMDGGQAGDTGEGCTCGDGTCEPSCEETLESCPRDCATCGDGICSPGEDPRSCAEDCCGGCGDGRCMGYACGEGPDNCGADCGTSCGNGTCDKGEAPDSCPDDCARFVCGNGVCEPGDGGPEGCPADCGIACGNCKCEGGEDFVACPIDCGYCGDGICSPCAQLGEETGKCVADCGGAVAEPAPDAGGGTSDEGSPSEPVLVVDLRYDGTRPIGTVEVFLYGQQAQSMVRCANLVPGFLPPAAHTMSVVRTEPPIAHTVTFTNFPGLETNSPQDYTLVAVGYEGQDAQTGPPVAWDCIDGTGERKVSVSFGQSTTVSMVLADLRRLLCPSGSSQCHYELDSFFDMPSLVPDSAEAPVNTVLDFFDEPPASLLSMICTFDNTALEDLCGLMSSDPNAPCTDQSAGCFTALGTIAFDLLDSSVAGLIEDNLPGAFGLGRDVRNVLEQLDLQATLTFKSEPDAEGFIAQDKTLMEWHTLRYRWTYGALEGGASCPVDDNDCGWRSYNLKSLLGLDNVLTSQFSGRLDGEPALSVEPFPLDLKYAALINSVLEKFVLPLLTGDPNTTTYEAFIGSLAGGQGCMLSDDFSRCCENFGEAVSDNSLHQDVIRVGCNALVGLAGEFLRTQLVGLSVGTGAALTLSTQAPCRMFDNDANAVFDQLGLQVSKPQDKRCIWHVELAPGVEGEARFFGCRGVPCSH